MDLLKISKLILLFSISTFLLLTTGCEGFILNDLYVLEAVKFDDTMAVGETQRVKCEYGNRKKETPDCIFFSENYEIATINDFGVITAKSPGKVMIYVQDKITGTKLNITLTVS